MRTMKKLLVGLALMLTVPSVFAQGPSIPDPPADPGGIHDFLEALAENVMAFVGSLLS